MPSLPKQLYRAEQVRALDRIAIEHFNIPGIDLMQRAGQASFRAMRLRWPRARSIAVFCGAGNNGGDGFIIARLAYEAGLSVTVYCLAQLSRIRGDAKLALEQLQTTPVPILIFTGEFDAATELVVDALLGTGLSGPVEGEYAQAIECINRQRHNTRCAVVSVDIPSGLHADTGTILGVAVHADQTVTYIGVKQGLLTAQGPDVCGQLLFDDLQINSQIYKGVVPAALRLTNQCLTNFFTARRRSAHKGSFGHVLIVGGNYGFAGSVRMAGEAALRAGAGKVTVACRPEHIAAVVAQRPELMCHGIHAVSDLKSLINAANCIVVGPGLGQDQWAKQLFACVMDARLPMVVDADALRLLAQDPISRDNWVLTPHPGEAAMLLDTTATDVQQDRFAALAALRARYGGNIVLKGNGTVLCDNQDRVSLCSAGNPGMASGGMGDVLSGILAACITQSGNLAQSIVVAVYLHARAADAAAAQHGERGLLASDLFEPLLRLVNPS